jgi:hypothetical protein
MLRAGRELSPVLERTAAESIDASGVCKQILHLPEASPAEADALIKKWQAEQLAARDGQGFVARVPEFSLFRGSEEPAYSFIAVDEWGGLRADAEAMKNPLRRDYVTGNRLFTTATQETVGLAYNPNDTIEGVAKRQFGEPRVTWEQFQTAVTDTTANLAAHAAITGVAPLPTGEQ